MVANLVERFADRYDFFIVTRNYDSKGDRRPYTSVQTDQWNTVGPAQVFYFAKGTLTIHKASELLLSVKPHIVYLNSAFSMPVRQFLRARRKGVGRELPVILAPCGEMSDGALAVKPFKKKLFLKLALASALYRDVIWKASFDAEAKEIRHVIGQSAEIHVAADIAPKSVLPDYDDSWKPEKEIGHVRLAFFSRVVPKKNLKFLLECLCEIRSGRIALDIIGPLEDLQYWAECQELISQLPDNVSVAVAGSFEDQRDALRRLAGSHFFAMPTLNENFGYVFLEAMAAGCPVIISDRTVWEDLEEKHVGWRVPLEDRAAYIARIEQCIAMDSAQYMQMSRRAREYSNEWLSRPEAETANANLLRYAMSRSFRSTSASV
ncbi:MAG: glycosyltransferase family 4 protein [Pyrinomonadaceae bacterium]